jgi:anthraniloyl-CoA monooxygenase
VKIHVVGGGPAGLYFSILMKKAEAAHEITVWERNAPDDTFGWGVVFSDETWENLGAADRESQKAITDGFATWADIECHYRGEVIRSTGHGFCGISRKRMLMILQERALSLGVHMRFGEEVGPGDLERLRDCDLLVAADGVNSRIREHWAERFGPSIEVHDNRYTWLGTRQSFEAFTFVFRENAHGLFQVHAYQFEPETSTFIVECDDASLRNAGLDRATEDDTIVYCQELFGPWLDGHPLLPNRSTWIQFRTVKNASWHHENVVLIGDAAHTAHFSVGSGTKLAMEDAIALAAAFSRSSDVHGALVSYEAARRPDVESLQRAAQRSREWFEHTKLYVGTPPEQLGFNLLTRSLRITHENLRLRDPAYVEHVDRWFMRASGIEGGDDPRAPVVPPMFAPFELRGVRLENRVVVSPMCMYSAEDGTPNDWHLVHLGSRAVGGAGLVYAEMTDVSREGRISPGCAGMYEPEHVPAWRRIVDFVHEHSRAKIAIQLGHAGRKGSTQRLWEQPDAPLAEGNWPLFGPSPVAWADANQVPREMTREDMKRVREEFVRAAGMVGEAGFDLLELHYAHGYLMSSFLTPLSNRRSDEYGGSLANRARFPLDVVDAVRDVWPDGPLSVRISATDWVRGGFDERQAIDLAGMLKEHGVDMIDVSAGQTSTEAQPVYGRAFQTPFADRIRHSVGIATIAVGNISTYDDVNTIVLAGRADLVAIARAHLADPYFTLHAAREQGYDGIAWPDQYRSAKSLRYLLK